MHRLGMLFILNKPEDRYTQISNMSTQIFLGVYERADTSAGLASH